ncbi:hypothetical protein E2C01_078578 [Portunus trituberculatus]|uniref:Uncharacterized protein n=1 Tax=Portunus trituberculatus TaxID=210409 RepID=A0A5B7IT45_PORTR|nr:hypothetical protein [Portunus trituberculatus]
MTAKDKLAAVARPPDGALGAAGRKRSFVYSHVDGRSTNRHSSIESPLYMHFLPTSAWATPYSVLTCTAYVCLLTSSTDGPPIPHPLTTCDPCAIC